MYIFLKIYNDYQYLSVPCMHQWIHKGIEIFTNSKYKQKKKLIMAWIISHVLEIGGNVLSFSFWGMRKWSHTRIDEPTL